MRLAPSCRATRHDFLWRQTSGVAKEVDLAAFGAAGLAFTGQGAQLQGGGDLKVGEAQGGLECDGGEPHRGQVLKREVPVQGGVGRGDGRRRWGGLGGYGHIGW